MLSGSSFGSRLYRAACACLLALTCYVVARAPLWTPAMAGARVMQKSGTISLVAASWECSERPYVCSTVLVGKVLVARVELAANRTFVCTAAFNGQPVACTVRLWYAPRLKPLLEIRSLPGVSYRAAMMERPWRVVDQGLLGEEGPLLRAGFAMAFLLALRAGALIRRGGISWIARAGLAAVSFVTFNGIWFMLCILMGYID
jgi:hypothetical protein